MNPLNPAVDDRAILGYRDNGEPVTVGYFRNLIAELARHAAGKGLRLEIIDNPDEPDEPFYTLTRGAGS